jgi:hypothetical protein
MVETMVSFWWIEIWPKREYIYTNMNKIFKIKHWILFIIMVIPLAWTGPGNKYTFVFGIALYFFWIFTIAQSGTKKISSLGLNIGKYSPYLFRILKQVL